MSKALRICVDEVMEYEGLARFEICTTDQYQGEDDIDIWKDIDFPMVDEDEWKQFCEDENIPFKEFSELREGQVFIHETGQSTIKDVTRQAKDITKGLYNRAMLGN